MRRARMPQRWARWSGSVEPRVRFWKRRWALRWVRERGAALRPSIVTVAATRYAKNVAVLQGADRLSAKRCVRLCLPGW